MGLHPLALFLLTASTMAGCAEIPGGEPLAIYGSSVGDGSPHEFVLRLVHGGEVRFEGAFALAAEDFRSLTALDSLNDPIVIEVESEAGRAEHRLVPGRCGGLGMIATVHFDGGSVSIHAACNEVMDLY